MEKMKIKFLEENGITSELAEMDQLKLINSTK